MERRDNLEEKGSDKGEGPAQEPVKIFDTGRFITIFLFLLALWSMFDNEMRMALGALVGLLFEPLIGFGGHYPLMTIFLASIIMGTFSTVVTLWHTDLIGQARMQEVMKAFNKTLREAQLKKQATKVEKLRKMQPKLMKMQTSTMGSQWKIMAYTFVIFIAMFAWLGTFISGIPYRMISVPWYPDVNLFSSYMLQSWILLYSLASIPFSFAVRSIGKIFILKKRLNRTEA